MSSDTKVVVLKSFAYYRNSHQSGDQTLIVQGKTKSIFKVRIGAKLSLEDVGTSRFQERYRLVSKDKKRFVTITGGDLKRLVNEGVIACKDARTGVW